MPIAERAADPTQLLALVAERAPVAQDERTRAMRRRRRRRPQTRSPRPGALLSCRTRVGCRSARGPSSNVDEPETPERGQCRPAEHGNDDRSPARGEQPAIRGDEQEQAHRQNQARQPEPVVEPSRRQPARKRARIGHQRLVGVCVRERCRPPRAAPCRRTPTRSLLRLASRQESADECQHPCTHQVEKLPVRARMEVEREGRQQQRRGQAGQQPARPDPRSGAAWSRSTRPRCSLWPPWHALLKLLMSEPRPALRP